MNGPKCRGCGIRFPYATVAAFLDGGECPACMVSVDPDIPRPRQCKGCAIIYGQLSTEYCSDCKIACAAEAEQTPNKRDLSPEKQELLRNVDRSLANRPNPHIRVRPISSGSGWDVTHVTTSEVRGRVNDKFRKGLQKYAEGMGPPPAPLPGKAGPSGVSNMIIFVEVLGLRLDGRIQSTFKPLAGEYSGAMLYTDFQSTLCDHVDEWGSRQFPALRFRDPDQMDLRFRIGSKLPPQADIKWATLYQLHYTHRHERYMDAKSRTNNTLSTIVYVNQELNVANLVPSINPGPGTTAPQFQSTWGQYQIDDDDDESAAEEEVQKVVATRERIMYQTVLKKEDAKLVPGFVANEEPIAGRLYWSTSATHTAVTISEESFERGQVKEVWKVDCVKDNTPRTFVAKSFHRGESEVVNEKQNGIYVKQEVRRSKLAIIVAKDFMDRAKETKTNTHDVRFLSASILHEYPTIAEGGDIYLFEPWVDGDFRKFSGTDQAGKHDARDHVGQTCDALAHFSLESSGGKQVLADIQGIVSKRVGRSDILNLFDIQIHSDDQTQGLGDRGPEGLLKFRKDHVCNDLCHSLGLQSCKNAD